MTTKPGVTSEEGQVLRHWSSLACEQVQHVAHDGYLYIILDPTTMMDTGSALHHVKWRDPERSSGEFRLIPQGVVPDSMRERFPDNASSIEYLES